MSIRNACLALLAGAAMAMVPPLVTSVEAQDAVTDEMLLTAQEDPNNWLMAIGNYTGNRYSKLSQINTSNVGNLVPKWIFSLGTLDAQNTTPVVHNGTMYVTAAHGRTYALDAEKGTEIWRYVHELPEGVGGNNISSVTTSCASTLLISGGAIAMAHPANSARHAFLIDISESSLICSYVATWNPAPRQRLGRGPQPSSAARLALSHRTVRRFTPNPARSESLSCACLRCISETAV